MSGDGQIVKVGGRAKERRLVGDGQVANAGGGDKKKRPWDDALTELRQPKWKKQKEYYDNEALPSEKAQFKVVFTGDKTHDQDAFVK